jgi:hypothetical protein
MENVMENTNGQAEVSVEDRLKQRKQVANDRVSVNKGRVAEIVESFNWRLGDNKIGTIRVHYSGSGDDGCLEYMDFYVEEHTSSRKSNMEDRNFFTRNFNPRDDKDTVQFTDNIILSDEEKETIRKSISLRKLTTYIEDMCYDMLEERHGGWEIDAGMTGWFDFNFDNSKTNNNNIIDKSAYKIVHEFTKYYEESESGTEEY